MVRILLLCAVLAFGWYLFHGGSELDENQMAAVELEYLLDHPNLFEGKTVTINGTVDERASLLGYGGLFLRDKAGASILVLSMETPAAPNSSVTVTGKFLSAFTLGENAYPVIFARPDA
jgi:hypothetical protein